MPVFSAMVAQLLQLLYGALRLWKTNDQVDWTPERASIALTTDASDVTVGTVVEQHMAWCMATPHIL
ncbi:hypothetical protein D4764_19G0000870 [Takifugu flavidus]|uniref:Reverse transcriptase/retrotransposon-derived protein RNase H-like domain-containing protein n=1 Tax=Takifugu flavidus TaxID=433684 RepID=A0A5C6NNP0_9TELE|nr:hypothetical protein D4764_19G0000870 [Takifugu flavidus]